MILNEEASLARADPNFVELLYLPSPKRLWYPRKLTPSNMSQQQGPITSKEVNLSSNEYADKLETVELPGFVIVILEK